MELKGNQIIGDGFSREGTKTFRATNPAISQPLEPEFHNATKDEIDRAMNLAAEVFDDFRSRSAEERAAFLEAIADETMALGEELLQRANEETGLPMPRLTGERGRAVGQAKLFAQVIREGSWVDARIDTAIPDREPLPKPDVRRMFQPIGPVVVFGASNFPLAISVIGCDTVAALGAGCPVVVKGHPAHAGTCELLARAVQKAAQKCGLPSGVFSMVQGNTNEVGLALVNHPAAQAVAFTGSLRGGRALCDAAAARPVPIPVYAEMGSTNPVFVLPGAMKERSEQIATGFVQSVTLGTGQFCTNPGLVLGLAGDSFSAFSDSLAKLVTGTKPSTMLHPGIRDAYAKGLERFGKTADVELLATSSEGASSEKSEAACTVYRTKVDNWFKSPELHDENFGPSSILFEADAASDLEKFAESLEGQLTSTIHGTTDDLKAHAKLIQILERKVGRLIFNGFPTGIEVCPSMHHGGPYPSASHSFFTSIGTAAILRFARPVCYQSWPDEALPVELQNKNSRDVWRLVNNEQTKADV